MSLETIFKNIDLSGEGVKQLEKQLATVDKMMNEMKNSKHLTTDQKSKITSIEAYAQNAFAKAGKQDMGFQDMIDKMKNL